MSGGVQKGEAGASQGPRKKIRTEKSDRDIQVSK